MSARNDRPASPGHKDNEGRTVTHIRRCHVCGTVTESEIKGIKECSSCGKKFAPFCFFDENRIEGISDNQPAMSLWRDSVGYRPLWGLTSPWEEFDSSTVATKVAKTRLRRGQRSTRSTS